MQLITGIKIREPLQVGPQPTSPSWLKPLFTSKPRHATTCAPEP